MIDPRTARASEKHAYIAGVTRQVIHRILHGPAEQNGRDRGGIPEAQVRKAVAIELATQAAAARLDDDQVAALFAPGIVNMAVSEGLHEHRDRAQMGNVYRAVDEARRLDPKAKPTTPPAIPEEGTREHQAVTAILARHAPRALGQAAYKMELPPDSNTARAQAQVADLERQIAQLRQDKADDD